MHDDAKLKRELRLALSLAEAASEPPTCEERQHVMAHTRLAALLLSNPSGARVIGACGREECYELAASKGTEGLRR